MISSNEYDFVSNDVILSAKKFVEQVARAASKLICTYCRIEMSGDYNEELHKPDVLKSGKCNWG